MKLHALRSPHRLADGVDLQDVTHLIKTAKMIPLAVSSPKFLSVMRPTQSERESSEHSKKNRVRETADLPRFPNFDSLPAAAGLTNVEAFRLSQRHALALLPAVLRAQSVYLDRAVAERFSVR